MCGVVCRKSLTWSRCKHGNHRNYTVVAFWPMENCQGSGDFSDECPTAVQGEALQFLNAGLVLLVFERQQQPQLSGTNTLAKLNWVYEAPCKLLCGQQCGINICHMHLLLLTSPYQSRIRGCSPSSASAGGGSPNHKKTSLIF